MTRTFTRPSDTRPYVAPHESGHEIRTRTADVRGERRQTWRQVAWHGQTGAIYGLHETPGDHEPGSFSPLYVMMDNEPVITDEP